jgi:hypothetical protein
MVFDDDLDGPWGGHRLLQITCGFVGSWVHVLCVFVG